MIKLVLVRHGFGELAKQSNTMILPANAADVGSMIATAMSVIQQGRPPAPPRV